MEKTKILIIENDKKWIEILSDLLTQKGYICDIASNKEEAHEKLKNNLYNLITLDLHLLPNRTDYSGVEMLRDEELTIISPVIVISRSPADEKSAPVYALGAKEYFKKDKIDFFGGKDYIDKLLETVSKLIADSKINTGLDIEYAGDLKISQAEKAIFSQIFYKYKKIYISEIGKGRSRAKIYCTFPEGKIFNVHPTIVKIDTRENIREDNQRYQKWVEDTMNPTFCSKKKSGPYYFTQIGAIQYDLVGAEDIDIYSIRDLQKVLIEESIDKALEAIDSLFDRTFKDWHQNAGPRRPSTLKEEYPVSFLISKSTSKMTLEESMKELKGQLGNFYQGLVKKKYPSDLEIGFKEEEIEFPNLVTFIPRNIYAKPLQIRQAVVHGDLNLRNVIVNNKLKCWLIDFSQTHFGHVAKDFASLEINIKSDLIINYPSCYDEMLNMEKVLCQQRILGEIPEFATRNRISKGAYLLIKKIREKYSDILGKEQSSRDYLISLLMHTIFIFNRKVRPWENKEAAKKRKEFCFYAAHYIARVLMDKQLPTRRSIAAYGIIKARIDNNDKYLFQLNQKWNNVYNFISGHQERKDKGDFKKTIEREIEEELPPLKREVDFVVKPVLDSPIEEIHYSERLKQWTDYKFMVYQVFFLKSLPTYQNLWQKSSNNKWFTAEELDNGVSIAGEKITRFPITVITSKIPGGIRALPWSTEVPESIVSRM